ncbi:MAG: alpha/beta hydrolase [Ruminococcus sp.]|nr:alpha/beta hydrolase [Ruminococcus sp.]
MPSLRYRALEKMFLLIGVNKMLDKEGEQWEKLLADYSEKQKKPLKVPYKKLQKGGFELIKKDFEGVTVYALRVKGTKPEKAVLYLFGGGYILPPDPGDLILCGQIAKACDAEVWFPIYPMAPDHRLAETLESTLSVYRHILTRHRPENVRIFGTSSGGGQAMSLCLYIKTKYPDVQMPGKLVLQSPGMQVPPSEKQRAEMEKRKEQDVMIPPAFFERIAPVLAKGDEAYLLSPLLCDISGFPGIDVFYGTHEVMYAYLEDLKEHCEKFGVPLNVHIGEGMMHCWGAMEFVPEAKAVRQEYFKALR